MVSYEREKVNYQKDIRVTQPLTKKKDITVNLERGLKNEDDGGVNFDKPLTPLKANRRMRHY